MGFGLRVYAAKAAVRQSPQRGQCTASREVKSLLLNAFGLRLNACRSYPIPMTSLRRMRTTQERRRWGHDQGSGAALRRSRSPKNLPMVWDDIWHGFQKSWKKFRKTKWKTKD